MTVPAARSRSKERGDAFPAAALAAVRACAIVVVLALPAWNPSPASAEPSAGAPPRPDPTFKRQRDIQERTRAMARELVSSVLDVQLRTLDENGLTHLPIYAEIASLRGSIDTLESAEMHEVVAILSQAEAASGPDRDALVKQAQQAVRRISVQLAAEQRQLRRRLKVANIAAQIRQVIRRQEAVLDDTEALANRADGQRESAALTALEQQKTVKTLFAALVDTLELVRGWEGPLGTGAAEGLRQLAEARVLRLLDTAEERLGTLDVAATAQAQRAVMAALHDLLDTIERAQGLAGGDRTALQQARELLERGRLLRDRIGASSLDDREIEALVNKQSTLRADVAALADSLPDETLVSLASRAGDAVAQAIPHIFEAHRKQALARQDKAIDAIEDLVAKLEQDERADSGERSSAQLAQRLDDMRQVMERLVDAGQQQDLATQAAAASPPAAVGAEQELSRLLAESGDAKDLPRSVRDRLEAAARMAEDAGEELAEAVHDATERQDGERAAKAAGRAIDDARRELDRSMADTERRRLGTLVTELSAAADALERAAAMKQHLAEQAADVEPTRRDVLETIDKVSAGVALAAPEAAALMKQGAAALDKAAQRLRVQAAEAAAQLTTTAAQQAATLGKAHELQQPHQETAAEDLAARQARIERDQALAETMAEQLGQQEQARQAIDTLSSRLIEWADQLPPELQMAHGQRPGEAMARGIAIAMFEAEAQYARTQHRAAEDAATVSGQEEVADRPLHEGLERARGLKIFEDKPPEAEGELPASPKPPIVPGSPEDTARMIAGKRAQEIAESLLESPPTSMAMSQQSQSQSQQQKSQQQQSQSQSQQSQQQAATAQSQSQPDQAQQQESSGGAQQKPPPEQTAGSAAQSADAAADAAALDERSAENQSWFAKLPPGVRETIRARSQRRAPRGYEEKLDRYFKNID